jgi:uncharacterized membrane protein
MTITKRMPTIVGVCFLLAILTGQAHSEVDPARRLGVVSFCGPLRVRPNMAIEFTGAITHDGMAGRRVTVKLFMRGTDQQKWINTNVTADVTLTCDKDKRSGIQGFMLKMTSRDTEKLPLGRYIFRAAIDPEDDDNDPADNAAYTNPVIVTDKQIRILLVSGDSGWEFRYLQNYLLRKSHMFRVSVWLQNADKDANRKASSKGMALPGLPNTLMRLVGRKDRPDSGYDLVILCDPKYGSDGFDKAFLNLLASYVRNHGKGLCYVAGDRNTSNMAGKDKDVMTPLARMLPVVLAANTTDQATRIKNKPKARPLDVTQYGLDHPLTQLGAAGKASEKIWKLLPGVFWTYPITRIKPSARVLIENTNPARRTLNGKPEPVLAAHAYGSGRVAYLGTNATWRWRSLDDGSFYRRFWGNMAEHLAVRITRNAVLTTGGERFAVGRRITVDAAVLDPSNGFRPLKANEFVILITSVATGRTTRELTLKLVKGKPGRFRGAVDNLPAGAYSLTPKPKPDRRHDPYSQAAKRIIVASPR